MGNAEPRLQETDPPAGAMDRPASRPAIAFWDLDHTLTNTDCDSTWKAFLMNRGLVTMEDMREMARHYVAYDEGRLDIDAYHALALKEFAGRTETELAAWAAEWAETMIRPAIFDRALARVAEMKRQGIRLCLITAANRVLGGQVAALCGFEDLLASEPEKVDGRFTGRLAGPCLLGAAKLPPMAAFCARHGLTLAQAAYYGDSINDVPILEAVGFPMAANANPLLRRVAEERAWPIVDWV